MKIKHDLNKQERERIFQLRYEVCIGEFGWVIDKHAFVCHDKKVLCDPLDETGLLFGAFLNNRSIGTCLANYAHESDLEYYLKLYNVNKITHGYNEAVSISTKLIVDKHYRQGSVAFRMLLAMYLKGLSDGIKYNFIDCDPGMVSFFYRLGCSVHEPAIARPDSNNAVVMVLELENEKILKARGSPLYKSFMQYSRNSNV
ncbi:MAG: hypothetical protein EPN21_01775 [Methylococcaceae bacterium]|nr:MAG: hypothetical protein EPN21_01775 [Methylococcaceae bacterium]